MSREQSFGSSKKFYQVYDHKLRTKVPEGHPDAVSRINKKGVQVFEKEVNALFGKIEGVEFEDSDFGKRLIITLDKNEDGENPVISFGVESKDGRDMLKKLPAIDLAKEVRIMPYFFLGEDGKQDSSGISIYHPDASGVFSEKVGNFFFDPIKKEYLHGFPVIDWDTSSEAEQKIYKIQRDDFLVKFIQEHVVGKFEKKTDDFKYPTQEEEGINPEDIGF